MCYLLCGRQFATLWISERSGLKRENTKFFQSASVALSEFCGFGKNLRFLLRAALRPVKLLNRESMLTEVGGSRRPLTVHIRQRGTMIAEIRYRQPAADDVTRHFSRGFPPYASIRVDGRPSSSCYIRWKTMEIIGNC